MDKYTIIVDTREQKPLFTKNIELKKLDAGDYSIKGYEDKIAIERKSLPDLFGTLGKGHARFKRELERAKTLNYFAIVIDGNYSDCMNKTFPGAYHSKMKGYVIMSILFTLHVKYGIIFFFSNNRTQSKSIIREIFKAFIKVQAKKETKSNPL